MISSRSLIVRTGIRVASPLALVVAAYLFFAGHNQPGGGFAAGLVLGAVVALRAVVGLVTPRRPSWILALGGTIAGLVAVVPILFGEPLLDQVVVEGEVPLLGKVKSGSALLFDAGVTILVVGLVVAVLEALDVHDLRAPDSEFSPAATSTQTRVAAQTRVATVIAGGSSVDHAGSGRSGEAIGEGRGGGESGNDEPGADERGTAEAGTGESGIDEDGTDEGGVHHPRGADVGDDGDGGDGVRGGR